VETLFAPWRFDYVTKVDQRDRTTCVFCRARDSQNERETLTLTHRSRCFALLNLYPYTSGHTMVAPNTHIQNLDDLDDATLAEMMLTAKTLTGVLRTVYEPHGFNIGFNVGEAAGAGIEEHLHLHIVPRWRGDTNVVNVIGQTRVIPEDLGTTFDKVKSVLDQEAG